MIENKANLIRERYKQIFIKLDILAKKIKEIESALRECKGVSDFEMKIPSNDTTKIFTLKWYATRSAGLKKRVLRLERYCTESSKRDLSPLSTCAFTVRFKVSKYLDEFIDKYIEHMEADSKRITKE